MLVCESLLCLQVDSEQVDSEQANLAAQHQPPSGGPEGQDVEVSLANTL